MINKNIFREYDIRGIVGDDLNEHSVKLLGLFLGRKIIEKTSIKHPYVFVGYDDREHCLDLFGFLSSGLNYAGCKVFSMGMVTTGVNYFSNYQNFEVESQIISSDASIMITGSHNPSEYNGFKITIDKKPFFGEEIYALGEQICQNESILIPDNFEHKSIDIKSSYISYIVNEFEHLKGLESSLVFDCGNGVANTVLEEILNRLDLNHKILFKDPDGRFPNHHPDPSEEKNLSDLKNALKLQYEYGFAYDGDADRVAFLTKKHNIKGDILALILSKEIQNPTVVGEVKCSQLMYDAINSSGGKAVMYKTGHSNLKVKIKELDADLAAEVSGHIFFNDRYFGFDDAIYATFRILELIKNGVDIDNEVDSLPKLFSTPENKIDTTEDTKFSTVESVKTILKNPPAFLPKILDIIDVDGVRVVFENGWGLVRASNTTPFLITRFEALSKEDMLYYQDSMNRLIQQATEEK
jgi:phosphomannomutase/phosphoglucomutase